MRTIKQALYVNSTAQNRKPDEGNSLNALATSFAFVLEKIPTHHLGECFQRAIRSQTDDFLLTAAAVNREYQAMLPELQAEAEQHATQQEYLLRAGAGSMGNMGVEEWKTRHNLPAAWRLGDPYPPESDLHGKPVPKKVENTWQCEMCQDARYVKEYPNGPLYPQLRPCSSPRCGF